LQKQARQKGIQIIVTTHSPNLASVINLNNIVLMTAKRAFSMAKDETKLRKTDYRFLQRFLDVTRANLFFARGVMIVEGDAENILLPTLARLLGRSFARHGVSIVNVGGVGLRRYACIFQRKGVTAEERDKQVGMRVACVADMDVMPNCAPMIIGKVRNDEEWPKLTRRRWRAKKDVNLTEERNRKMAKASGQCVETFVSDEWTLEYDLALGLKGKDGRFTGGLAEDVYVAACLAEEDEAINAGRKKLSAVTKTALKEFSKIKDKAAPTDDCSAEEVLAAHVYAKFARDGVSKAIAAQYLAERLQKKRKEGKLTPADLRERLPKYLTGAIDYVTEGLDATASALNAPGKAQ
jgi:putative ATP-dependent endonuclease of OLD family